MTLWAPSLDFVGTQLVQLHSTIKLACQMDGSHHLPTVHNLGGRRRIDCAPMRRNAKGHCYLKIHVAKACIVGEPFTKAVRDCNIYE